MAHFTLLEKLILLQLKQRAAEYYNMDPAAKDAPDSIEPLWKIIDVFYQNGREHGEVDDTLQSKILDRVQASKYELGVALNFLAAEGFIDRGKYKSFYFWPSPSGLRACREFEQEI